MPSSPLDPSKIDEANDRESAFRKGLVEIDNLIDSGVSLSGKEPNCFFLNVPDGDSRRFATASAAFGIDFDDDARAPVLVDWDRDGDLDLWVSNRTGPLVRFLQNDTPPGAAWVAFRLVGVSANRDAIGARVTVTLNDGRLLSRSLKAGEGYLGQSSKTMHFGLGDATAITSLLVHWPGGREEEFEGANVRQRYRLVQGEGQARPDSEVPAKVTLPAADPVISPAESGTVRAIAGSRWPIPQLPYRTFSGENALAGGKTGRPVLVNLWATWCVPCIAELEAFGANREALAKAGLDLIALSVDGIASGQTAASSDPEAFYKKLRLPFPAGHATEELLSRLEWTYTQMFGLRWSLPVPTSVLLDGEGQILAIYKGAIEVDQVLEDLKLSELNPADLRDASLPFPGRWFHRPESLDPLVLAINLMDRGQLDAAHEFAFRAKERFSNKPEYSKLLTWIGDEMINQDRAKEALPAYAAAYREDNSNVLVLNNVAWQLATHADPSIRDGERAVQWAERAAQLTKSADPAVLDTLAAAYAEVGDFPKAIATAKKALEMARAQNNRPLWEGIAAGLKKYEAGQPYTAR